ncbi:hypothetical protein LCGC14_0709890 [marine sediment metagenome]|uniref:Terminase small subunit n=1 Tax=marine sediment metagenome TaxID=412755 RepID=A0A0F9QK09_9ZZZZ
MLHCSVKRGDAFDTLALHLYDAVLCADMPKQTVKKKRRSSKGRKHHPHTCGPKCRHKCGDVGGRTQSGRPCRHLGGNGVEGKVKGVWALCWDHDPDNTAPAPTQEQAFEGGLTGKEALFVFYYPGSANCNATEAAKLAGYTGSRATLQATGAKLMTKPKIKAAILKRFDELSAPGEEIIARMTADARGSMLPLVKFDEKGRPQVHLTAELLLEFGTLIKTIDCDPETGYIRKLTLNDGQAARRDLAKIRKLMSDAPEVNILNLQDLSDDELAKRLATLAARLRPNPQHELNGA